MLKLVFLLTLSASCSHLPKSAKVRHISVTGEKEARNVIRNQINFLSDIFQQSYDPYYKLPKWDPACLLANRIGKLEESEGKMRSLSELWLKNNEAGYCPLKNSSVRNYVIFEYCSQTSEVLELKVPADDYENLKDRTICE